MLVHTTHTFSQPLNKLGVVIISARFFAHINKRVPQVTRVLAQTKHFDSKSCPFHRDVLFEGKISLPQKKFFINRNMLIWNVHSFKFIYKKFHEMSDLIEAVTIWIIGVLGDRKV